MGCGQSSLKGDDLPDLNSQPVERPIKKVQTNFSDVNYDQDSQQRRMTEYAPNETPRQYPPVQEQDGEDANQDLDPTAGSSRPLGSGAFGGGSSGIDDGLAAGLGVRDASYPHQTSGMDLINPNNNHAGGSGHDPADQNALKPYQTFDGTDWDNDNFQNQIPNQHQNHGNHDHHDQTSNLNGYDPTSRQAKRDFAKENDPARHDHFQGGSHGIGEDAAQDQQQQKGSWLGQKYANYQASKAGPGVNDEDLRRYTGKDRAEFDEWAETQPGVGARQPANDAGYAGAGGGFVS
ncbi:uncharacterized protein PV06_06846 [Exophiala oligosperma]|uniref:Uncharacterized protein n=1 Tax=Exophiala oligosperma TaxID=215243 RepID=A0A0D2DDY1_9EURO|nr:uncharacterized protein PV06_06846 [Exophiala oligosperma]KIW41273.1 hypothetical protein PV06_06846 [Exophiala oligosperma]